MARRTAEDRARIKHLAALDARTRRATVSVPRGWEVVYHELYDVDPDAIEAGQELYLCEDQFQMRSGDYIADVGWYPDNDPSGAWRLVVHKVDGALEMTVATTRRLATLLDALANLPDYTSPPDLP